MMASAAFPCTSAVEVELDVEVEFGLDVEVGVGVVFGVGPGIPAVGIIIMVIVVGIITIIGLGSDALFRNLSGTYSKRLPVDSGKSTYLRAFAASEPPIPPPMAATRMTMINDKPTIIRLRRPTNIVDRGRVGVFNGSLSSSVLDV